MIVKEVLTCISLDSGCDERIAVHVLSLICIAEIFSTIPFVFPFEFSLVFNEVDDADTDFEPRLAAAAAFF
mgnify:FL=1